VRSYRPAASRTAATLTAAALALAACLPSQAATGTGWQVAFSGHFGPADMSNALLAVTAPSTASAWAVGGTESSGDPGVSPVALQWAGSSWQASALPSGLTGTLGAVSAPAGNDVWAASYLNGYLLHWDGTTWSVAKNWPRSPNGQSGEITGVTAFSPTDVWVFGASLAYAGLGAWHLSAGTWHKFTGLPNTITSASALSPTDMWAVGGQHQLNDSLVHYDGRAWQPVTSPALSGLQFGSVLAESDSDIWATATPFAGSAKPELLHFNGHQWRQLPVTLPKPLLRLGGMTPDGHGGLWFLGVSRSAIRWAVHRSAAGIWSATTVSAKNGGAEDLALIPGTTSLWAVGWTGADVTVWGRGPGT
jgi:hypothetical protein